MNKFIVENQELSNEVKNLRQDLQKYKNDFMLVNKECESQTARCKAAEKWRDEALKKENEAQVAQGQPKLR